MTNKHSRLNSIPTYFRNLGLMLLLASFLFAGFSILKIIPIDAVSAKTLFKSGVVISLLLLTLSKFKKEDELLLKIRSGALVGSIVFAVVVVIFNPLINWLIDGSYIFDMVAVDLLIHMFVIYFLFFYIMKKNLQKNKP
ncbi:MAG: hypothetical protein LAT51_07880 [Flavobacteriaceae bacterium]|nr:hypothetical protein [Flavobacteriaceae bacterium]